MYASSEVKCIYVLGLMIFASFFDFSIRFCCDSVVFCCDSVVFCCDSVVFCCDSVVFCCDSVVFLVFHLINIAQLGKVHLSLVTAWQPSSIVVSFLHYNLHWDLSLLGTGEGSWPQSSNAPSYAKRPEVADRGAFLIVVVSLQYVFGECNVLCVLNISCNV